LIGLEAVLSQQTEREMTKKTRRKIDAALKAKIVSEAGAGAVSVADLAQRYEIHPKQIPS
jgi:transposase